MIISLILATLQSPIIPINGDDFNRPDIRQRREERVQQRWHDELKWRWHQENQQRWLENIQPR